MTQEQRAVYHYSFALDKAKGKATPGAVLVVKEWGKGNKEFEFKKLESVKIDEKPLCDIIKEFKEENLTLNNKLDLLQEKINILEETIKKLAEYIDNQRFL